MKLNSILLLFILSLSFFSCSKSNDTSNRTPETQAGKGSFIVDGTTYSGICAGVPSSFCQTGLDVSIIYTQGTETRAFTIYNIPTENSGTFNITDGYQSVQTCNLWTAYLNSIQTRGYASKIGTLTKTGPKSFTFSCTVYYLQTNETKTITGSGTYTTQ